MAARIWMLHMQIICLLHHSVLGSYYDEYSDNFVNLIRSSYDELYFGNEYAEINPTVYDYASWSHLNTHVFAADAYFQVNVRLRDYSYLYFGTGSDARIYYDGTNLIIDPKYTGTGRLSVEGLLWLKDENTEYNGYHVGVHNEFSTNHLQIVLVNIPACHWVTISRVRTI